MNSYLVSLELINNDYGLLSSQDDPWVKFDFRILAYDQDSARNEVGRLQVSKLNYCEMLRRGLSLWLAFDDFSMETSMCYDTMFTKGGNLRRPFCHEAYGLNEYFVRDFHFLDRIEISEKFKGNGIAGFATQIYLENFANGDAVAYCQAFPLQFEERCSSKSYPRSFSGNIKACRIKLCSYYESIGFRRIGKTEHFFFVVDDYLERRSKLNYEGEGK